MTSLLQPTPIQFDLHDMLRRVMRLNDTVFVTPDHVVVRCWPHNRCDTTDCGEVLASGRTADGPLVCVTCLIERPLVVSADVTKHELVASALAYHGYVEVGDPFDQDVHTFGALVDDVDGETQVTWHQSRDDALDSIGRAATVGTSFGLIDVRSGEVFDVSIAFTAHPVVGQSWEDLLW